MPPAQPAVAGFRKPVVFKTQPGVFFGVLVGWTSSARCCLHQI